MATLAPDEATPVPNRLGTLVTALLVVALAWVAARWTWAFVAPPGGARAVSAAPSVDLAVAARLFGGDAQVASGPARGSPALRLKGVVAPSAGSAGAAVLNVNGKDVAVLMGGEIQPGVKLEEVLPDHVVVSRAGVRERVDLEVRMAAVPRSVGGQAAGFRLGVNRSGPTAFAFSRKDLESALKDPNQLGFLGKIGMPPGGGVRLDEAPPGSLANRLGLQPGDIIKRVNGQAVASAGDLARLHQQFATTSLVQAEILRGGQAVQLNYTINP
jgi:general secretion pathway protein C